MATFLKAIKRSLRAMLSAMGVGDALRKVVAARVACKLPPRSALNLGFSTPWLRIVWVFVGFGCCV